ncbi:MAG: ribonuclease III family protein [Thermoproteota archaeon]
MTDSIVRRLRKVLKLQYPAIHYLSEDSKLSVLGDALVNYIASVSETIRKGAPTGTRVDNETLMKSVRESGLRNILTSRMDKHALGDAAEALIAYAWIQGAATLDEYVETMLRSSSIQEGMTQILKLTIKKVDVVKHERQDQRN